MKMWYKNRILNLTFALGLLLLLTCQLTYSTDGIPRSLQFDQDLCGFENVQALWLQDSTTQMASQLPSINKVLKDLQSELTQLSKVSDLAISLFTDRQNDRADKYESNSSTMCYRGLTNFDDYNFKVQVDNLSTYLREMKNGNDEKNSQLLALLYGAMDERIGWSWPNRPSDIKVVILMTDSLYHNASSNATLYPSSITNALSYPCGALDYPSFDVLVEASKIRNLVVIFVVAENFKSDHATIVDQYVKLSRAFKAQGVRNAIIDVGKDKRIEPTWLLDNVKKTISDLACERTDVGTTDEATTDEGATDEGATDEGATDEGATDEGTTDEGATDEGATDEGATDEGTTDEATTDEGSTKTFLPPGR